MEEAREDKLEQHGEVTWTPTNPVSDPECAPDAYEVPYEPPEVAPLPKHHDELGNNTIHARPDRANIEPCVLEFATPGDQSEIGQQIQRKWDIQ
jgi:hypothetical protein